MKKILFVIESLSGGGAEKVLTVLLKHIDKKKFDITLCTVVDTGVYVEEVKKYVRYTTIIGNPVQKTLWGKLWYQIKYKCIYSLLPMKWIYQLFVPKNNDVEVAFVEGFSTKLMAASTNSKAKKIAWVHIDLLINPWTDNVFKSYDEEQKSYSAFNQIVCVSDTVKENFKKKYHIIKNVIKIYNPLDIENIIQQSNEPLSEIIHKHSIRFITVGRLVEQKGYDRLLSVFKRLKDENFKFELFILGEGSMFQYLNKYINENKLSNYIKLFGFQKNPYNFIKTSDCFICSSRSEGFSLVIAEAMILGLPIISTYCSGPNELLEEGEYGMLVSNTNEELYNIIKKVLFNTQLLQLYSQKSLQRSKFFDINTSIKEIEKILLL